MPRLGPIRLYHAFYACPRAGHALAIVGAGAGVVLADYLTGPDFSIILFYVLLSAWGGWWLRGSPALIVAAALAAGWWFVNVLVFYQWHSAPLPVAVWNALMVLGVFLLTAYALSRTRLAYEKQRALNASLQTAMDEIKVLEGLVPICSWCKDIRTESGAWVSIESFIAQETPAQLTHSICPTCASKVAP
ncbi:MAG: hypothetical protein ACHQZQ_03785 [SAR324 cluster bacterium]